MCRNNKYWLEEIKKNNIYKYELNMGDFGICKWNIDKKEMFIFEKITGYKLNSIKSMTEFINIIAYEKDKMMAIQDLDEYINGVISSYNSTFRIRTKNGEIKWVLFKGKIFKDEIEGYSVLSVLMFNVTDNELHQKHDGLTNLPNREIFFKKLNNSIKLAKANNKKGALIYIDIDNFKVINDSYGSYLGDLTLKLFAQSITNLLGRYSELARLSGDEFAIIIHQFNDINEVEKICNEIYEYFKKPFKIMDNQIYITASLGIAVFPDDSSDIDELLKFCNFAIYISKHKGKNMYTFFDKQISNAYYRKILIESELKNSIINNELKIYYQPQIDTQSNKITGIEALLRWDNDKLGIVSPTEFIPAAENMGYIIEIDNWVLEEALKMACIWKEKGYKFNTISVNVSPIQLKKNDFMDNLLNICSKYNILPSLLEIEITEGTLLEICKEKTEVLNELIQRGVHIAIDDFGTGYSSLSYLIKLPVNTLKIDKVFIDNIENEKNKAVIKSIVDLSKILNCEVIAEGVETKEQMYLITGLGCNLIQGYYFSKPLPENEIEDLLKNQKNIKEGGLNSV